jgi:signal transduction histidine kinase
MAMSQKIKNNLNCEMLKSIVNNIKISINVFNKKGERIFVNPYYYHLSGTPEGTAFAPDMITGENKKKGEYLTKKLMRAIKTDKIFEIHNFYYKSHSKQTKRYFDFIIGPLKNNQNEIIGGYTTAKDVTMRFVAKRKLVQLNNLLEKKIQERTATLEKMNQELKKISEEKNMIVSDVAHEIKTILTIIRGNLDILNLDQKSREPIEIECCNEINEEIKKMNKISSDLVFIVKSKQYADTFKFERLNAGALIGELVKKYKNINKDKIKIINIYKSKKPVYIFADKEKISALFSNLIENSIKFNEKKTKLWISIKNGSSLVRIVFKDNGIGIEKEKIGFIFSPFFKVDKTSRKRDDHFAKGFGLGLALCKKIAEAHKGEIIAKSDGLNTGTTFEVVLPKK